MEKKNKIFCGITIFCALLVAGICTWVVFNEKKEDEKTVIKNDTLKFKSEYEKLNEVLYEKVNKKYPAILVDVDSNIYYKSDAEIVEIMKNEKALIYFGFSECPWCRSMIETLLKSANDNDQKVYYVNIKNIRNTYEYVDKKIVETKKGNDSYYEILNILGDNLQKYYVTDSKNKKHNTKKTRLYAPTVVGINKGNIIGFHEVTVESQKDPFIKLNQAEQKELYDIYNQMIKNLQNNLCTNASEC